ncbi:pentapeptide repeat-containing protein [Amycolatopsis circi]|uniref:pentapeptide repeat-containing protein n=1 Tax=Amycolatopsis circi TaxID=871959 RepID=UPI0013BEA32D|nr:pentapeptide repeat-containing protein [Amycolatopsis circi]
MKVPETITALAAVGALILSGLALNATHEQNKANEQAQLADRYTRAVAQLDQSGPEHLDGRIGAVYALERLARDAPQNQPSVVEMLSAFVRATRPAPVFGKGSEVSGPSCPAPAALGQDAWAALIVLGRRDHARDGGTSTDLSRTCLNGIDLSNLRLDGAVLKYAVLAGSDLSSAQLNGADLNHAYLCSAKLDSADLVNADLAGACLNNATMIYTKMIGANVSMVDAEGANFTGAYLQNAQISMSRLKRAIFMEAEMRNVNLVASNLAEAQICQVDAAGADLSSSNLSGASLAGAFLVGANLSDVNLSRVDFSRAQLTNAVHSGAVVSTPMFDGFTEGQWW